MNNDKNLSILAEQEVEKILIDAIKNNYSDIHFNPLSKEKASIKIRKDSILKEYKHIPMYLYRYMETFIKGKAGVPKQEKRNLDGKIEFEYNNKTYFFRVAVSYTPVGNASKITLRLLPSNLDSVELEDLGFFHKDVNVIKTVLDSAKGIVLISGPTGSGKTTTLYASLKYIKEKRHILTIEDPVESYIEGITQLEVKKGVVDFSDHLKSALRHDPDVIMVGEIRDKETAKTAVSASLSGHLVLGTVHANNSIITVMRMADLGADIFNLAFSLKMSSAQRLLPKQCEFCLEEKKIPLEKIEHFYMLTGKDNWDIPEYEYIGEGCENCAYTGINGRVMIYEVIFFNEYLCSVVYELLKEKKSFEKEFLNFLHEKRNFYSMIDRGIQFIHEGKITFNDLIKYCL